MWGTKRRKSGTFSQARHTTYKPQHTRQGFTLIETMVAITILVVAVSAPLTLAAQSLFAAFYAKDQTTAFYLAQEAVEVVRNKRDSNMLAFLGGESRGWLDDIPVNEDFHVDVPNDEFTVCSGSCLDTFLLHNGSFYNHQTGDATRFSRGVLVTPNADQDSEATITVTVEWQTGSFKRRSFLLEERIFNWIPNQE